MFLSRSIWIVGLAAMAALLYAALAIDIFQDETPSLTSRRLRIELDEFLLFGTALVAMMAAMMLNQHRGQVRERARRVAAEHRAVALGYRDALTGIANRRAFDEALARLLVAPFTPGTLHAVLLLDLNGFKAVNDTYGHGEGDALLKIVAQRIAASVRDGDCAARIGGDEFAILAPDVRSRTTAAAIAARVAASIEQPVWIGEHAHRVGTGIGIALAGAPGIDPAELTRRADLALYAVKRDRGERAWRFHDAGLEA